MQNLKQIYRSTYAGETVISTLTHQGQEWKTETEYVPNAVFSTHTTNQAVAIANGESRKGFDLVHIKNHKGGLLAVNKLQSYGCNGLYRDFTPDFLVTVGDAITTEVAESGYTDSNIAYTNAQGVIKYPGKLYLIPQNVYFDSGALAAYMACFDGHKKVFLLGYDNYDQESQVNNVYKDTAGYPSSSETQNGTFWQLSLFKIMETYSDVEFVRVMPTTTAWVPAEWEKLINFRQIDYNQFTIEADLG